MWSIVGKNIRKYRLRKDLTQEQLAEMTGISTGYVSHIERARKDIKTELLAKIAEALNVSPTELYEEDSTSGRTITNIVGEPKQTYSPQINFSMPGTASPEQIKRIKELARKLLEIPEDDTEMILDVVDRFLENKK